MVLLDPYKADVQFGQLPPPRHLEQVMGDLGAPPLGIGCERTDYPRHVAQLALAHGSRWRRRQCPLRLAKNNVSNYAGAEGTANERQEL